LIAANASLSDYAQSKKTIKQHCYDIANVTNLVLKCHAEMALSWANSAAKQMEKDKEYTAHLNRIETLARNSSMAMHNSIKCQVSSGMTCPCPCCAIKSPSPTTSVVVNPTEQHEPHIPMTSSDEDVDNEDTRTTRPTPEKDIRGRIKSEHDSEDGAQCDGLSELGTEEDDDDESDESDIEEPPLKHHKTYMAPQNMPPSSSESDED
jgi:hypothetical protein